MGLGFFKKRLNFCELILAGAECILHLQRNLEHSTLLKGAEGATLLHCTTDTMEL